MCRDTAKPFPDWMIPFTLECGTKLQTRETCPNTSNHVCTGCVGAEERKGWNNVFPFGTATSWPSLAWRQRITQGLGGDATLHAKDAEMTGGGSMACRRERGKEEGGE